MALALRPGFAVDLACPGHVAIERLTAAIGAGPMQLRRSRVPGGGRDTPRRDHDHLVLVGPAAQQRFWSPWLTIDVAPREGGAQVRARFSPHPSVWTGFAFGYLTVTVVLVLSLAFAGAQAMMGSAPWALWGSAGAAVALVGLWSAAQLGQRLARAEMEALAGELERALAACQPTTTD
ncbi:MAG: hypothetical protein HS111_01475 [Kofleriaceae bacterium]|nr:hypothetical protein [Kofleriaceae bacterium]MCL4226919.1 hypothetical protein [Myxococcales bacterium]